MTRITRRIALLLSLPLTAIGCQSASVPPDKPSALMPRALSAENLDTRTAAALQASDHGTGEMMDTLKAIERARAIVQHNMCNADTAGYKATDAKCQNGGKLSCQVDFTQGSLKNTGWPINVGVQGQGFFKVRDEHRIAYTRNGNFIVNKTGELVLNIDDGYKLIPPVTIPTTAMEITIGIDGAVTALLPGQTAKTQVGTLYLVQFVNPQGLGLADGIFFTETEASGPPTNFTPGDGGTGYLLQGFLEASNVNLDRESVRLHYLDQWHAELLRAAQRD